MDLEALRTFVAVVEGGSLLAAAESLTASRATVRRRLEELEVVTRVALVHRGPRGVAPTAAGELLARRGRLILAEADRLLELVQHLGAEPVGTIRVAAPVGMPPLTITWTLAALRVRWPHLHFDLRFSERPVESLTSGAELAISLERARPVGPYRIVDLPAAREGLVATPHYLERHGPLETVDDLARHTLLVWRGPESDGASLPTLDGGSVAVRPTLVTTDIHLLRLSAASGAGIAYVPDPGLPEPAGAPLVPVLSDRVGSRRPVRVVVPEALVELPKIRVILEALAEVMRGAVR